uniref:ZP domain-containing protein n=1 Tax=Sinocyclocheilus grahami TaxID=75366 RepID=A0A672K296_SINGR
STKRPKQNHPPCAPVESIPYFAIYQFPVTACGTTMMVSSLGIGPFGSIKRDSHFEYVIYDLVSPSVVQLRLANGCSSLFKPQCSSRDEAYTSYYSDADYPITKVLQEPVYVEVHIMERTDPNVVLLLGDINPPQSTQSPPVGPSDRWVSNATLYPFPTHYKRFVVKMFTFVDPASLAPLQETVFQGSPNSVLEGWCPAEFSSNLPHTCLELSSSDVTQMLQNVYPVSGTISLTALCWSVCIGIM